MKVIFLDIDGVLVNRASFRLPGSGSGSHAIAHPDCVAALNRILSTTGAFIVISSVWRKGGVSKIRDILNGWGVIEKRVLDCTPDLASKFGEVYVATERGDEIQAWLDGYTRKPIEAFVILDDDADMKHLRRKLVQTEGEHGLTEQDATRAISFLTEASPELSLVI